MYFLSCPSAQIVDDFGSKWVPIWVLCALGTYYLSTWTHRVKALNSKPPGFVGTVTISVLILSPAQRTPALLLLQVLQGGRGSEFRGYYPKP